MINRMRTQVSLVIILIDDMNNKIITGSNARVWILGERPPIRKAEGYYVFMDMHKRKAELLIESSMYEKQSLHVDLCQMFDGYTTLKVRMVPNRSYLLPAGTTCIEGRAEPGSLIRMFCRKGIKPLKLLYDYGCDGRQGQVIHIYHPDDMNIEGKNLYIENKDGTNKEFFRISQKEKEGGKYFLSVPLKNSYKKIGTTIYSVYTTITDEKGQFFLPIVNLNTDAQEFYCEAIGTKKVTYTCNLVAGKVNKISL